MINTMELRRKRVILIKQGRELLDKAEGEKRELTAKEATESDRLLKEADKLNAEIEQIELRQQFDMATASKLHSRVSDLSEADRAFLSFVRRGRNGLTADESRALVEDSVGEYIVSPDIELELERTAEKLNVIRQLSSVKTTAKDRIKIRSITEATVGWGKLETGTNITESTPVPAERTVYVEDLVGLVKVGKDELDDSDYDLAKFLADSFGRAIATAENLAFLKGLGHGSGEPDGITLDPTLVSNALTTAAHSAVTIDDFLQMIYEVPAKVRQGSAWVVNSATELAIRQLRSGGYSATDGVYLWQPSLIAGTPPTFAGFPIYNADEMDTLSDIAGIIAIFGNFQLGYRILDRREIRIQRLDELYSEAGLTGFIVSKRVAGYVPSPANKALVLLKEHSA